MGVLLLLATGALGLQTANAASNTQEAPATAGARASAVVLPHATPEIEALICKYAQGYGIPVELVRRVVKRESGGNPKALGRGGYYGLMQIAPATARTMGYNGAPEGLLDAQMNLRYAVKYLRGAYLVAGGNSDEAIKLYARGYYYDAKDKGLLEETGLRPGPKSPKTVY